MGVIGNLAARMRWIGAAKTPASAVVYSLLSRMLILLVNLSTGIIVARTLGPAGRGATAAIMLWMIVIPGLLTLGVPEALRYQIRRKIDDPAEIYTSALVVSCVLGAGAYAIGFAIIPYVLARYPDPIVSFARVMMLFSPLVLWGTIIGAFYESLGEFRRSNAMIYVPPVLQLIGLVFLCLGHRISPQSVAVVYEAPFALMAVASTYELRRFLRPPRHLIERVRSLLHYGVRAYGIDIVDTLSAQIDQAMVVRLLSSASFGMYAVALNASRIVSVLGASLNAVLVPTAAGLDRAQAVALVSRSARLLFATTLLAIIALDIALPVVIPLAYGRAYADIIRLTQVLTIALLFGQTTGTYTQAFLATGRPEIATILQCVGIVTTGPLMLVLIPRFGLMGAAYAVNVSNALRLAIVLVSYPLFLKHRIPRLLPTGQDVRDLFTRVRAATSV